MYITLAAALVRSFALPVTVAYYLITRGGRDIYSRYQTDFIKSSAH